MINVAVVSLRMSLNTLVWKIKLVAPGEPFLGWAQEDGTFTPGINAVPEAMGSMIFRTAEYAVEWAQERGWNVVSVIQP
jgi:hypothetical protein